jgi:hypothetical protein
MKWTRLFFVTLIVALFSFFEPLKASADPAVLNSQQELLNLLSKFKAAILFLGHGSKSQFGNMGNVQVALDATVSRLNAQYGVGGWVAMYGGDGFNPEKPDIGAVMNYLKQAHHIPVLAIQSDVVIGWGGIDKWIDYVRYIPTVQVPALDEAGQPIIENGKPKLKTFWGALSMGNLEGLRKFTSAPTLSVEQILF